MKNCVACKGKHKFEDCKVASWENLNMEVELARARGVANFNNMGARFDVSMRAVIHNNKIAFPKNLTEKVRSV